MILNDPDTLAEVEAAFAGYETALTTNDVAALDDYFWQDPNVIRYGIGENLYGHAEIAAFRAGRPSVGLERTLSRTVITTFGREFATASTLFERASSGSAVGRQMQTWVKMDGRWCIVAAHVSLLKP